VGIAVKRAYLAGGKGAERAAYELTEVNASGVPVGQPFVGKRSLYEEPSQIEFHKISASTQFEAARLQRKFNEALEKVGTSVPRITFLSVWYYTWHDETCALLCEKRLDNNRYQKWNDNKGGVDTLNRQPDVPADDVEGSDSDSDSGSDDDDAVHAGEKRVHDGNVNASNENPSEELVSRIIDEDVPQAFSHWSAVYTQWCVICKVFLRAILASHSQTLQFTLASRDSAKRIRGRKACRNSSKLISAITCARLWA